MKHPNAATIVAVLIALGAGVATTVWYPLLGLLASGLVFPGGVHGDYPMAWFVSMYGLNFAIVFAAVYYFLSRLIRMVAKPKAAPAK